VTAALEDFIREADTMKELVSPRNRLVMAVGSSDSGKTTLVECLVDFFSGHAETGVVDLDMGQSHIGPPTTIAWGRIKERFDGWDRVKMEDYYFTGTTTPVDSLLPTVVGARLMTDNALTSCRKVVVDTTGLISEPAGRVLKQLKIDLLCPDIILALERSHELAHILDAFRFQKRPKIFRLPVVGARLMTDNALTSCRKVVVDTTGLISEPAGRVLKQLKIDLLCPDIILALERSHELAHILDAFRFQKRPKIFRLPVPEEVKTKTAARRGQYRFEKMKKYFAHSHTLEMSIRDTGIRFTREPLHFSHSALKSRIVSFRDEKNIDIGLGFIEEIEPKDKMLLIRTPMSNVKFASLVIGRAEMDMANSLLVDKR